MVFCNLYSFISDWREPITLSVENEGELIFNCFTVLTIDLTNVKSCQSPR